MHEHDPQLMQRPQELARAFDRIGDQYDARPGYPPQVFELLVERCGLGAGAHVLEVGAGVGQATLPMLDLGAAVTVVDPGAALMQRLLDRTAGRNIEIIVSELERAALPAAAFDLVTSATAFHWVEPITGVAQCARVLRPNGWLAVWWTLFGDEARPDPFHDVLEPLLEEKAPQLVTPEASHAAHRRDLLARAGIIETNAAFGPVDIEVIDWEGVHTAVELRRLFATFGGWIVLPDELRTELLDDVERIADDEFGGTVRRPYQTLIFTSRRVP
jgi:ubiquinone/menaquinone biosynthesis C-methylase UbiE